ncbi:MAG: chemotaxis protein CheD [bacterium]|nr:chemotaxis protein CheD [bacterium]
MNKRIVGVGEMIVSDDPEDLIITYALGSCLGVVIYDPVAKVGGLLHAMLPDAAIARKKKEENFNPAKFVNTGIPLLFKEAYKLGAKKNKVNVRMAGCSKILDESNFFNIGKRNYAAARKLLWKNNVMLDAEHCDQSESITLSVSIRTGTVMMRIAGKTKPL